MSNEEVTRPVTDPVAAKPPARPRSKPKRVLSEEDDDKPRDSPSSSSEDDSSVEEEDAEPEDGADQQDTIENPLVDDLIVRLMSGPLKPDAKARSKTKKKTEYAPLVSVKLEYFELDLLCDLAIQSFAKQKSLLRIEESQLSLVICGDLHGQFKDLRDIFHRCGPPYSQSYLFLGDYVDRGVQGVEVISLLLALKIKYPKKVFMLRGNHEDANTCSSYGFYDECINRFMGMDESQGERIWQKFVTVFNWLPLAAVVNRSILCMHGGISPNLESLESIENIARPAIVPPYGLMCDLVWADPEEKLTGWSMNARGISLGFSEQVVEDLCRRLQIDLVVRGHQLSREVGGKMFKNGYRFFAKGRLLTIFSAPNYLNTRNSGCVLKVSAKMKCRFVVTRVYSSRRRARQ